MPSDDGVRLDDHEDRPPARPPSSEGDPEGPVDGRKSWPPLLVGVDRELLPEGELDDRLSLSAPEEGRDAAERGDEKGDEGTHRVQILAGAKAIGKPESGSLVGLSFGEALGARSRVLNGITADKS